MGASYDDIDGPKICFNSVKSWTLGWYRPNHLILDANDNTNFHVKTTADFNVNLNAVKIANKDFLNYDSGVHNAIGMSEYQSFNNNGNVYDDKYCTITQLNNMFLNKFLLSTIFF